MNDTQTRKPQEVIEEVLGRWTVTDLREMSDDDLAVGDERFYSSKTDLKVIEQGEKNFIKWWKIDSDGKQYECRRFKNFVFCSCLGFFFSKKMCKHLAVTTRVYCVDCFQASAKIGKYCYGCYAKRRTFLKPSGSPRPPITSGVFDAK